MGVAGFTSGDARRLTAYKEMSRLNNIQVNRRITLKRDETNHLLHIFDINSPYNSVCEVDFEKLAEKNKLKKVAVIKSADELLYNLNSYKNSHICSECRTILESDLNSFKDIGAVEEWFDLEGVGLTEGLA